MFRRVLSEITNIGSGNNKIMEPGCGSGLMSSYLGECNQVTVLDRSRNALSTAQSNFKRQGNNGNYVLGDLYYLPFRDDSFDIVWNQGVLEHFRKPSIPVKEMYRVTKKGGYTVIFIPAFLSPLHLIWIILGLFGLKRFWPFDDQQFYRMRTFRRILKGAGITNARIQRLWIRSLNFSQVAYVRKNE